MRPLPVLQLLTLRTFDARRAVVSTALGLTVAIVTLSTARDHALAQDYNGDGRVDVCDEIVWGTDLSTNNLRSDFNNDGVVNLADEALFVPQVCSGPVASAAPGTATIGVYFDVAGTQTFLPAPASFTVVDLYIVAHGVTSPAGIGGFTFQLTENSSSLFVNDFPFTGWYPLYSHSPQDGITDLGGLFNTCFAPASTIVLDRYALLYLGDYTTINIHGANICDAPSVLPSYVSCGVDGTPCDWTYFGFDSSGGTAVIGPPITADPLNWSSLKATFR